MRARDILYLSRYTAVDHFGGEKKDHHRKHPAKHLGLRAARNRLPNNARAARRASTGMASPGSRYPRFRYTPALAAAVTPIMKLLVVVETLNGMRISLIHRQHFQRAGADPEQAGNRAGDEHQPEPAGHAPHKVMHRAVDAGINAVHPQSRGQRVGLLLIGVRTPRPARYKRRRGQDDAERDGHNGRRQSEPRRSPRQRADGRRHFQENPDAQIGETFLHVSGRRAEEVAMTDTSDAPIA